MEVTELAIGAWIAEVKSKLAGLGLHLKSIGLCRSEVNRCPGALAQYPQGEHLGADESESGNHQPLGTSGKGLDLGGGAAAGELPDEEGEQQLRGQERQAGFHHGFRELLIDRVAVGRNILRWAEFDRGAEPM